MKLGHSTWMVLVLTMSAGPWNEAGASGVGISTNGHLSPQGAPTVGTFWAHRPGGPGSFSFRDLEFHWDPMYERDALGLSVASRAALDTLGAAIVNDTANPMGAPYQEFRLIYDFFRLQGGNYDRVDPFNLTSVKLGRPDSTTTYPAKDRSHADYYLIHPDRRHAGNIKPSGGAWPSDFQSTVEDTSTGSATPLPRNSVHGMGPTEAQLNDLAWTRNTSPLVWVFNHELQHSMPDQPSSWSTEQFSAGAEAIGGVPHGPAAGSEVPYTWSLLAYDDSPGGSCTMPELGFGQNYPGRRMFAAYIAYNFRGADLSTNRPADPNSLTGLGDDLLWRWARTTGLTGRSLGSLRGLIGSSPAYFSKIDPAAGATTTLSNHDLLQLLHHNWRVANYLNAPAFGDGRYGYPTQFGFSPAVDVSAWQPIDTLCTKDDLVAVPPKVTMSPDWRGRATTRVGSRLADDGLSSHSMVLQPFGAEYWITRSSNLANGVAKDLVVTVNPEGFYPSCVKGSGRLLASVAAFSAQTDSLWEHPEWVQSVSPPQWVDVDSLAGELQFMVPGFGVPTAGSPRMAAVTTISLGDGPVGHVSDDGTGIERVQLARYRISFDLATAPYPQPYSSPAPARMPIVTNAGKNDFSPVWSPTGKELAYTSTLGGTNSQIYRRAFARDSLNLPQVLLNPAPLMSQFSPDWSPRGDWVVYVQDSAWYNCDLFMKNVKTNELRRLTSGNQFEVQPVFQPNGQGLAYTQSQPVAGGSIRWELRWRNLSGTVDRVLVGPGSSEQITRLRWDFDGSRIYFFRHDSLYTVGFAAGDVQVASGPLAQAEVESFDLPRGLGPHVIEASGENSEPCTNGTDAELYRRLLVHSLQTGGEPRYRFHQTGTTAFAPRISLDGTRTAFASAGNDPTDHDLYLGILTYDQPPRMNPGAIDATVAQGIPFSLNLAAGASDPDGDPIFYKAAYLPPGASFSGSTFSWSNPQPPTGSVDAHYVAFVAFDSAGAQDYRVVRYEVNGSGGGCPFADVLVGSGWIEGNSISVRNAMLAPGVDVYQLPDGLDGRNGLYSIRIRENEAEVTALAQVALVVVDRSAKSRTFSSGDRVLEGSLTSPVRVTSGRGEDLTGHFVGPDASGLVVEPGEVLTLDFARDLAKTTGLVASPEGAATHDEGGGFYLESGGKELPPEMRTRPPVELASAGSDERVLSLTGIDIQVPDGEGGWMTVQRHYPRAHLAPAAIADIPVGPVRLVFAGRHRVRSLGRIVSSDTVATRIEIPPVAARHSRLGDVRAAVARPGASGTTLVVGDTLVLQFEAPPAVSATERDVYLLTRGAYRAATAAISPGDLVGAFRPAPQFSLGAARPNPSAGATTIPFSLPVPARVQLRIYDAKGRLVRALIHGDRAAGGHEVDWDRRSDGRARVAPGVYFYRLTTPLREATGRVVILGE